MTLQLVAGSFISPKNIIAKRLTDFPLSKHVLNFLNLCAGESTEEKGLCESVWVRGLKKQII